MDVRRLSKILVRRGLCWLCGQRDVSDADPCPGCQHCGRGAATGVTHQLVGPVDEIAVGPLDLVDPLEAIQRVRQAAREVLDAVARLDDFEDALAGRRDTRPCVICGKPTGTTNPYINTHRECFDQVARESGRSPTESEPPAADEKPPRE